MHVKTALRITGLMLLAAGVSGCASTKGYLVDRGRDAGDIFTVTAGIGLGAKIRVGPLQPALIIGSDRIGLRDGVLFVDPTPRVFGGGKHNWEMFVPVPVLPKDFFGATCGIEGVRASHYGDERHEDEILAVSRYPLLAEGSRASYYTQVEAALGLGLFLRCGVNPGEMLDFVLGWFGVDVFKDDIALRKAGEESSNAEAPASGNRSPPP